MKENSPAVFIIGATLTGAVVAVVLSVLGLERCHGRGDVVRCGIVVDWLDHHKNEVIGQPITYRASRIQP